MAKQKKVTGARVEYWKNKKGEYNYRIIGKTGKLLAGVVQGFKRKAGVFKNVKALTAFFGNEVGINIIEVSK